MKPIPLLISVRNLQEAQCVAEHPIAVLDFKEPTAGALGAVPLDTLQTSLANLNLPACTSLSMAAGELLDWADDRDWLDRHAPILPRFSYCKLGLANTVHNDHWQIAWNRFATHLPSATQPVLVGYLDFELANSPTPDQLIAFGSAHPTCQTVLWDTWNKDQTLFDRLSLDRLRRLLADCRSAGLKTVLAGSIGMDTLEQAWKLGPDLIGVRGAVCDGNRAGTIDADRVTQLIQRLIAESVTSL